MAAVSARPSARTTVAAADGARVALEAGVGLGGRCRGGRGRDRDRERPGAARELAVVGETVVHWTTYEPDPSGVAGVATIRLSLAGSTPPVATVPPPHELDDEAAAVGVHAFDEGARHHGHGLGHGGLVGGRRRVELGVRA